MSSYAGAANQWIDWFKSISFSPLQTYPTAVALCLTNLSDRGLSPLSILGAAYGIAWLHKKLGCPNPVDDPLVFQTLAGHKRLLAGPSKKNHRIEYHHVRALIPSYGHIRASSPSFSYRWYRRLRLAFVPYYVGQNSVTCVPVI